MKRTIFLVTFLLGGLAALSQAGDALTIGYNADGVWTSVTYYCSGTPKGGADYKDEAGAREAATQDLKRRAGEGVVKVTVFAASDRTGHVAYARGKPKAGKDLHAVGYGGSKQEAESRALADLKRDGAVKGLKVSIGIFPTARTRHRRKLNQSNWTKKTALRAVGDRLNNANRSSKPASHSVAILLIPQLN